MANLEFPTYISFAVFAGCVFLWVQTFRHIRYIFSFYGAKYPLALIVLSALYGFFEAVFLASSSSFTESTIYMLAITFFCWGILVIGNLALALWRNPHFQRGMKNYNNLGALNEDWAPKSGAKMFGGAKPPPPPNSKTRKEKAEPRHVETAKPSESAKPSGSVEEEKRQNTAPANKNVPLSANQNVCATCSFWTGEREIDASRVVVRVAAPNVRGKCAGGGNNHAQVPANGHCASHDKWGALK